MNGPKTANVFVAFSDEEQRETARDIKEKIQALGIRAGHHPIQAVITIFTESSKKAADEMSLQNMVALVLPSGDYRILKDLCETDEIPFLVISSALAAGPGVLILGEENRDWEKVIKEAVAAFA